MSRQLNVSIIQMPVRDTATNLQYLRRTVDALMAGYVKPELIVGVEFGISSRPECIPGPVTDYLGAIAAKHGIYFIPGTMAETAPELEGGQCYNTCPVFAPDGSLLRAYRKKAPFRPGEHAAPSQDDDYCIFRIAEKDITVGVLICYDQFFPEIPRTLALEGAELIVCPALDPIEYSHIPDILPRARALENECFYIWTCGAGEGSKGTLCGRSVVVDPEGAVLCQCGGAPATMTKTLDFDLVTRKRLCGRDQHLNSLRAFQIRSPYAGRVGEAPVYKGMPPLAETAEAYARRLAELGFEAIPGSQADSAEADKALDELYEKAKTRRI